MEQKNPNSQEVEDQRPRIYRFDIFKGVKDSQGQIHKKRSVGVATHVENQATYRVHLKTFLKDEFFLLPEQTCSDKTEFTILTRMPSCQSGRKYFWHTVGTAKVLSDLNAGLMELKWDLFEECLFLNLCPRDSNDFCNETGNSSGTRATTGPSFLS